MASLKTVDISDLANERIILFNTDSVQNEQILSRFRSRNLNANVIMHMSQLKTIENVLKSGQCGVFLFSSIDLDPEQFVKIDITPMITSSFGLIWKKGTYISGRADKFIRFAVLSISWITAEYPVYRNIQKGEARASPFQSVSV